MFCHPRAFFWLGFVLAAEIAQGQDVESFGMFVGMNFPFTIDQGLYKDSRFYGRFTIRSSPFGFNYGYDHVGHGFLVTPSFLQIGQKFIYKNTVGGEIGEREVQMKYISIPVALKLHLNDLSFFRLSVVAAINFDYLIGGKELISHSAGKVRYPLGVAVPDEPGYTIVYDGVFVPEVHNQVHVGKNKFKPVQISAGVGFRSDFDFSEDWSINFDGRAVFGILDTRKASYIDQLKGSDAPDLFGQRREVYLTASVGISRIVQIKEKFRPKSSGNNKRSSKSKKRRR